MYWGKMRYSTYEENEYELEKDFFMNKEKKNMTFSKENKGIKTSVTKTSNGKYSINIELLADFDKEYNSYHEALVSLRDKVASYSEIFCDFLNDIEPTLYKD